jgi:hypothetical protein
MEFNIETDKEDGKITREGTFTFLGQKYSLKDNPFKFILGGLISISLSVFLLISSLTLLMTYSSVLILFISQIIPILFYIIGTVIVLGVIKYAITGNAQPFMKIETSEGYFSVSLFKWE